MIKRLIFDVDNTIIKWEEKYTRALQDTMNDFNIKCDYKIIDKIIEKQEVMHKTLTKEQLLLDINKACDLNLNINFIDELLEKQKEMTIYNDENMINLFSYLSQKYEIVMLSNWFKDCQRGRLKNLGIDEYFIDFFGGDDIPFKPNKQAFIKAMGEYNPEECLMIGDNIEIDIIGAKNLGIKTILLTNKVVNMNDTIVIKSLEELKNIL